MRRLLLTVTTVLVWYPTAMAYWPTTAVTRKKAERDKLPLSVALLPLGDGTLQVKYEAGLVGPFAHLRAAELLAADGNRVLLQVPIPVSASSPGGASDGRGSIKGAFRVSKELLDKCRLRLDCPVEPLSMSGQTFSVDLASYLK